MKRPQRHARGHTRGETGEKREPSAPQQTRSKKPKKNAPSSFLIVGIGASAGGLNAFKAFFEHMPENSGMAFVLVQHLAPHHESMLVELLARHTAMTVATAKNGMRVAANSVYVIPPNATLTIERGILRVTKPAPAREHRHPVDTFFSSLAEDQGERAVSIVLSGTGSDGTLGLRKIKEHGGLTVAQAEFDSIAMSGMPQSAVSTGLVDHTMAVEEMPAMLVDYRRHMTRVAAQKDSDGRRPDAVEHLPSITALLRSGTGHDFSRYKPNTLVRRIQRRMQVLRIDSVAAFIERLRKDAGEVDLLFQDFLIGVTQFFRDPDVFDALQTTVIPKLLENKKGQDQVRIWVPGCATGEEVYSIAILLREATEQQSGGPQVQIFGSDIDEAAVAYARAARYPKTMSGMSQERIDRWFAKSGGEYCPIKKIREMCVFSSHSIIKDPPFSKLDLISCRNLLIYLESDLQDRVMHTFHYALRPGGYLLLGRSEGVTRNATLFESIDKKHRLYRRQETPAASYLDLPYVAQPARPKQKQTPPSHMLERVEGDVRRIMAKYSPAYVVIDKHHDILSFSGGEVGRFLEPSAGTASLNLFEILRKMLRPPARAAVQNALKSGEAVTTTKVAMKIDGKNRLVGVIAEPLSPASAETGLCIVAFQDVGATGATGTRKPSSSEPHETRALEHELQTIRMQLTATIDELATANEELKSANEEYQSVNEELQSSNEELETAKEEMQSVNEELQTINVEMSGKNDMLARLNSDFKNLLDSTQIATIFLDDKLRVKSFTPGMTGLFHLRDADRGRPITEIVARMGYNDIPRDVKTVKDTLAVIEREVRVAEDNSTFLMRIRPYRSQENVIDGVVITFVDITHRKQHDEIRARLAAIVDSSQDAIIGHTLEGVITSWNAGAEAIFGYTAKEAVGKPFSFLLSKDQYDDMSHILAALKDGKEIGHFEIERTTKAGNKIDVSMNVSPVKDDDGTIISASTIAREFTERKIAEDHKNLLIAELDHRIKNTLSIVTSLISQTLKNSTSPEIFAKTIEGRIQALSRVHRLLTQNSWDRAELGSVIEAELSPYRSENKNRIIFNGNPNIILMPKATLTLAMAFHELATNAAKYGALSTADGKVDISWTVQGTTDKPQLAIEWNETGGPPVKTPSRRGFGSHLIERAVTYELQASVDRVFRPEGLHCRIAFPMTATTAYVQSSSNGAT